MLGKKIRLERLTNRDTGKMVIVPMDHGVTVGPIPGLINMPQTVNAVAEGGANAVLGHVGLPIMGHRGYGKDVGLILHLSASTGLGPDPNYKVLVNNVERAIRLGADGVSIHVNIGSANEPDMLRDMGEISDSCERWGMPLLAMLYTRGPKIKNEYDAKVVKHAARVGAELGADIIKVVYTGSVESFTEVVEGCRPIPVVIAGGEKVESDRDLLEMVEGAMKSGGNGVSIGRNAFQHRKPERITKAISMIVHDDNTTEQALEYLESDQ